MEPILALMIPITALMIPIVAIWSSHLQKMEQLRAKNGTTNQEIAALRSEIENLKEIVHTQVLAMESNAASRRYDDAVRDRIGNSAR